MQKWETISVPTTEHVLPAMYCECGGIPVLMYRLEIDKAGDIAMFYKVACPACGYDVDDPQTQCTTSDTQAINNAIENWNYVTVLRGDNAITDSPFPL